MIDEAVIETELKDIISDITGIPTEKIEREANFIDDLGIASIMAVDIVAEIENKYEVMIPEDRLVEMDCLDSVVNLLMEELSK